MKKKVVPAAMAILLVFAAVVALVTWRLRERIRGEILAQEGTVLHAVAHFQAARDGAAPLDLVLGMVDIDGIIGIRVFDRNGDPVAALPRNLAMGRLPDAAMRSLDARDSLTVLEPDAVLYTLYADPFGELSEDPLPIMRVIVNLDQDAPGGQGGVAEFILDGSRVARALADLDRHLLAQSLLALAVGGGAILAVLIFSLVSLQRKNRELAQANRDLTLHLKTAALGAISTHLFHGLKHAVQDLGDGAGSEPLQSLIQDVMDVIQEGDHHIAYSLNGAEILEFAARPVRDLADSRGVRLVMDGEEGIRIGNRQGNLVILAVQNLLRNAVEASPARAAVECRITRNGQGPLVSVQDHGTGIPLDQRRHLFEFGYSAKPGGHGIGLSISRQLCRMTGGDLRLASSGTDGSRFEIRLPGEDAIPGV